MQVELRREVDRHWLRWSLFAWVLITAFYIWQRWPYIYWFALGDTDDNMRMMQVRAWLNGQSWYDLTQYRMDPPNGFNIHWSRIVDLPIAGLILFFRMFTTNFWAERLAAGIAPLIPLSVVIAALSFTVRQLISRYAWPIAIAFMLGCTVGLVMFMPERIDHHNWQLAMLMLTVAGLADNRQIRSGMIIGLSCAVSLNIGLEMLPYCAMAGAIVTLRWVWDRGDVMRLKVYALSLAGGCGIGFAAFASNANHAMRCDALTPVWLSVMLVAGALLYVLAWWNPTTRTVRLIASAVAGVAIGIAFAKVFPQCLGRPEQASPELMRIWLDNVREAKPIYKFPLRNILPIGAIPAIGLIGTYVATWIDWKRRRSLAWVPVTLFVTFAIAMLFWQVRAGPAAQLLALPGITALAWIVVPWFLTRSSAVVRVVGAAVAVIVISGSFTGMLLHWFPVDPPSKRVRTIDRANARCTSLPYLLQLNRYIPAGTTVFTHVDLGPRLIDTTDLNAIAGPYHRNGHAILDVHFAFMGSPDRFRRIARLHHATVLLVCPNMSETTNYRARAPGGFYDQLAHGKVPKFLTPIKLPKKSPFRAFRIKLR
ncbi:hypothetical protein FHR23_000621 [Stakelama sediminis]|uniref:AcrB/AcrD/AcrF family protein n=1 Tax=Stakelama sediminis TaxID=463200 RepID=A0A840YVZ7_9SPHN|nr:AcrB/AcrD/AcrF family protein [Stakelama sediminis]MBB5717714.1 hypothetical protein [Stakelama sediminis]